MLALIQEWDDEVIVGDVMFLGFDIFLLLIYCFSITKQAIPSG